jgi:hypothetical protein
MVFNATFNNISVISLQSVINVEEAGVPGDNHRPAASHWQTLSHNVISITHHQERTRTHKQRLQNNHLGKTNSSRIKALTRYPQNGGFFHEGPISFVRYLAPIIDC